MRWWRVPIAVAACAAALACGDEAIEEPSEPAAPPEASAPTEPEEPAPSPALEPPAAVPAPEPAPPAPPSAEAPAPEAPAEPAPPAEPEPPPISLDELAQRIKETPAIGTFSKLALKNDIDDLVDELRRYHERKEGELDALHARYEALVLKLMTLLEAEEPELALALARSRRAIWSRLVNPVEFAKLPA